MLRVASHTAGLLVALFLLVGLGFSQAVPPPLAFDVAEVKINKSGQLGMAGQFLAGGRVTVRNAPMSLLVSEAYHVPPDALSGGPGWFNGDRFDVIAKSAPATSEDDPRLMLRTLLAERFKLAVHTEEKPTQVYVMTVLKSGPKLEASGAAMPGENRCAGSMLPYGRSPVRLHTFGGCDLAEQLPRMVSGYIRTPVVDQTGVTGTFQFKVSWTPVNLINDGPRPGRGGDGESAAPSLPVSGYTIFESLQRQLGLKLENRRLPMPLIVIDHVERLPAEN